MTIHQRREDLKKIIDQADEQTLDSLEMILSIDAQKDWYAELNDEQKKLIDIGLKQLKAGEFVPHEKAMQIIKNAIQNKLVS